MPSRKFHSKSRHGCGTCKQSKVRCDLQRPICKRCARLERPCSFANEDTAYLAVPPQQSLSASSKSTTDSKDSAELTSTAILDLELMHHYSTAVCFTLADKEEILSAWQFEVPKFAFRHEFLLHGLLALSALHFRHINPQIRHSMYGDIARNHQSLALSAYIPLLQEINQENSNALFAFSAILGATSFAFLQDPEEQSSSSQDLIKSFIDIFELLVGSTVIAVEGRDWLRSGTLSSMLRPNPFLLRGTSDCSPDAKASLDAVLDCVKPIDQSSSSAMNAPTEIDIYASCTEQLTELFPAANTPVAMDKVIGWPALVGYPLISKLKQFDPVALIILAHYGAALHVNDHIWYLKDLGNRLVRAISDTIGDAWKPYLSWPLGRTYLQ